MTELTEDYKISFEGALDALSTNMDFMTRMAAGFTTDVLQRVQANLKDFQTTFHPYDIGRVIQVLKSADFDPTLVKKVEARLAAQAPKVELISQGVLERALESSEHLWKLIRRIKPAVEAIRIVEKHTRHVKNQFKEIYHHLDRIEEILKTEQISTTEESPNEPTKIEEGTKE